MRRAILGLGLAALFVAAPVAAGTAGAAPPIKTTIVLTCDKGVDATATVTLQTAAVGGIDLKTVTNADLNCGPDSISGRSRARVVVSTDLPAGAALVSQFDVDAGTGPTDCSSPAATLPLDIFCSPIGGSTAHLSVD
jgi:hypothetical protein